MITFFITIFLLLAFSSLFILGFYKLTRHQVVVMPNGRLTTEGFLLKWWSEFWEHIEGYSQIRYEGDQLEEKYKILVAANKKLSTRVFVNAERLSLGITNDYVLTKEDRSFVEEYLQVKTCKNGGNLFLYLEEPQYRFPEWIRLPISGCSICMSGPYAYGGMIYWLFVHFQKDTFSLASHPQTLQWLLFIPFCIVLSFVNYVAMKKLEL